MPRIGPRGHRVWHARRNIEMLGGLVVKHIFRKRLKLLFTSASQRKHQWFTKWLIRQMDQVVSTSFKTSLYLERPSHVVHHGIDPQVFAPAADRKALRQTLGLPSGFLIGCYGRIRKQKGTDIFVDAMIDILPNQPGVYGIIMGRATHEHQNFLSQLKARVEESGLGDRLLFLPEVPVYAMASWYQVLDLFVAPQRWEGFGLTPLEAMACGVPVVASRVGAFDEIIVDSETGYLVEAGSQGGLQQAVRSLLDSPEILKTFTVNSRARVVSDFSLMAESEALGTIYNSLLSA